MWVARRGKLVQIDGRQNKQEPTLTSKKQNGAASDIASIFTKALYNPEEAMDLIGVSRPTLYREIKKGSLKLRKIGRKSVFHRDDLIHYVNDLPTGGKRVA